MEGVFYPGVHQGCSFSCFPAAEVGMALKASTFWFEEGTQALSPGTKVVIH